MHSSTDQIREHVPAKSRNIIFFSWIWDANRSSNSCSRHRYSHSHTLHRHSYSSRYRSAPKQGPEEIYLYLNITFTFLRLHYKCTPFFGDSLIFTRNIEKCHENFQNSTGLRRYLYQSTDSALNALTLSASRITPLKARREPQYELAYEASWAAFAYATPPYVYESQEERAKTRELLLDCQ